MSQPPSNGYRPKHSSHSHSSHRASQIQAHIEPPSQPQQQQPSHSSPTASTSSTSNFPFPNNGGYSKDGRATATCYCGAVQLEFPTTPPALIDSFICNCSDCRKITASMFASNLIIATSSLVHLRGQATLTEYTTSATIATGNAMSSHFCSRCGSLMYRRSSGFPRTSILRLGTVDDFALHEGQLKPRIEQFAAGRVCWLGSGAEGVVQEEGNYYAAAGRGKRPGGSGVDEGGE